MSQHRWFGVPASLLLGVLIFASLGFPLPAVAVGGSASEIATHGGNSERGLVKATQRPGRLAKKSYWSRAKAHVWGSVQRVQNDVKFAIMRFLGRYFRLPKAWAANPDDHNMLAQSVAESSYGEEVATQMFLRGFRFMRPEAVRNKLLRGPDGDMVLMWTTDRYGSLLNYVLARSGDKLIGVQLDPEVFTPYPITPPFEIDPVRFTPPGGKPVVAFKPIGNYQTPMTGTVSVPTTTTGVRPRLPSAQVRPSAQVS